MDPIGYQISQLAHSFKAAVRSECEKRGIPSSYFHIFRCLHCNNGRVSQKDIVTYAKFKPSTISIVLSNMESDKLIKRVKDEKDARVTYIELTDEGKEKSLIIKGVFDSIEESLKESIGKEDLRLLDSILNKAYKCLERRKENA